MIQATTILTRAEILVADHAGQQQSPCRSTFEGSNGATGRSFQDGHHKFRKIQFLAQPPQRAFTISNGIHHMVPDLFEQVGIPVIERDRPANFQDRRILIGIFVPHADGDRF